MVARRTRASQRHLFAPKRLARTIGAVLGVAILATSCSADSPEQRTAPEAESSTTSPVTAPSTTTTLPSILPPEGTIPLPLLKDALRTDDLVASSQRAVAAWKDSPVECYPSRAEALAARDQFARVAKYLANARTAARALASVTAFKDVIALEAEHRTDAATREFLTCDGKSVGTVSATTLPKAIAGDVATGLAAGGTVEVPLNLAGTPAVDQEFTVADPGTPCDGLGANTTFLVNSQDSSGRWVLTDVIVDNGGATLASVTPSRAGPGAIEYLAYCGTADKRHGVVTYNVRPLGDTTTTAAPPATTSSDPEAPLVVIELPTDNGDLVVDTRATEVAVEPESVTNYLAANDAVGGIVIARLNLGDWVALRETQVTWVPVGPGTEGLETRIVGSKARVDKTIAVTAPSTTTTSLAQTTSLPPSSAPATSGSPTSSDDTTIRVIVVLLLLAVSSVMLSRLRLRRRPR